MPRRTIRKVILRGLGQIYTHNIMLHGYEKAHGKKHSVNNVLEAIIIGGAAGAAATLLHVFTMWIIGKSAAKLNAARAREARHSQGDNFYHWMSECQAYPDDPFAKPGTGDKEPCVMCRMLVGMAYESWSMFQLPFLMRQFKKRFPEPE